MSALGSVYPTCSSGSDEQEATANFPDLLFATVIQRQRVTVAVCEVYRNVDIGIKSANTGIGD